MDDNTQEAKKRGARGGDTPSKRAMRREEIRQAKRKRRTIAIGVILAAIIVVGGLLILPAARSASASPGAVNFTRITPEAYQNVDGFKMGNPNAKVKIEVFEDFMCVACKNYTLNIEPDVFKQLVDTGQAYYIMYQFPFLDQGLPTQDSHKAANAAMCAADQNMYWQMKQILFVNSDERAGIFSDVRIKAFAESIGMDMTQFNACYDAQEHQDVIAQHKALGAQYNVSGTPSLFVNGVQVTPGQVPSLADISIAVANAAGK